MYYFFLCLIFFYSTLIASKNQLDTLIENSLAIWKAPGVAVSVIYENNNYSKGFGVREIKHEEKINEETLFSIGSLTKAFTSTSIAILAQEKKVKWDDPIIKYYPSFYLFDPYVTQNTTFRDILSHRIGLENHEGDMLWEFQPYTRKEIVNRMRLLTPTYAFRTNYAYQNLTYILLGEVIESITELTWDQFIKEKIFNPLGMKSTISFLKDQKGNSNIAFPHAKIENSIQAIPWDSVESLGPAGSIVSNINDMAKWLRFQVKTSKDIPKPNEENSFIDMFLPHVTIPFCPTLKPLFPEANFLMYGLGWFLYDYQGKKVVQHDGIVNGMSSLLLIIPEIGFGVVVLVNLEDTLMPYAIAYKIMDTVLKIAPKYDWDKELLAFEVQTHEEEQKAEENFVKSKVPNTLPTKKLKDYEGIFEDPLYGKITIWQENKESLCAKIIAVIGKLEHWQDDTFRFIPQDKTLMKPLISFRIEDGNIKSLSLPEILPKTSFFKEK